MKKEFLTMHLWTEYEGLTIAGAFPLRKLLRSEGRSAFFATTDTDASTGAVIRLTEAHFDEDETLRRWQDVRKVQQENLIAIRKTGSTTFDGVALTYAVLEPEDASLDQVLAERPLTSAEALQVGRSVVAALQALHQNGLVHQHLQPANVLAVGEVVKLRSDCVRPCVPDAEFSTADDCARHRREDVRDLGLLLLRCLTLEKEWHAGLRLPAPFDRVVPNAINGTWTLAQVEQALGPIPKPQPAVAPPSGGPGASSTPSAAHPSVESHSASQSAAQPAQPSGSAEPLPRTVPLTPGSGRRAALPLTPAVDHDRNAGTPYASDAARAEGRAGRLGDTAEQPSRRADLLELPVRTGAMEEHASPVRRFRMAAVAAAAMIAVLVLWHLITRAPAKQSSPDAAGIPLSTPAVATPGGHATAGVQPTTRQDAPPTRTSPQPTVQYIAPKPSAAHLSNTEQQAAPAAPAPISSAAGGKGWYVVAYTYYRQQDAQTEVARISARHPGLQPQISQPGGRGAFLVTLGGPMARSEANALLRKARSSGMPRDTFVRAY